MSLRRALLLVAAFGLAVSSSAVAGAVAIEPGVVRARFSASFSPNRLPSIEQAPVVVRAEMKFTTGGPPPPALEEFEIGIDRHARLNLKGIPVCRAGGRDASALPVRCKESRVGSGTMDAFFQFPEDSGIVTESEVSIYRTAPRDGARLAAITEIPIPVPRQIVIPIAVARDRGRYALKLTGTVPKLAGGAGSVTQLGVRFHKGVFSATCPDRHLDTRFATTFVDGTRLGGSVLRHCTPSP